MSNKLFAEVFLSIPAHVGTTLTDREAWEELYMPKLTFRSERINAKQISDSYNHLAQIDAPVYLFLGSLYGNIRSMVGLEELSYLAADDEDDTDDNSYILIEDNKTTLLATGCFGLNHDVTIYTNDGGYIEFSSDGSGGGSLSYS